MSKKAYLVAELDFGGPVPIVRQTAIFSTDPQSSQIQPFPNRVWATLMVAEGLTYHNARRRIVESMKFRERDDPVIAQVLRFLRDERSPEEHAMLYGIDRALDDFVITMKPPAHPFFRGQSAPERHHPIPILD